MKFGTPRDSRCFIATELYGNTAEQTERLRQFRDTRLMITAHGRLLTSMYYEISPGIVKLMRVSPRLKRFIKLIIDNIVERITR